MREPGQQRCRWARHPEEADSPELECEAVADLKMSLRYRVWDALEAADAVLFPRPCHQRIPNCLGLAEACGRLLELPELREATVVKVHPSIGAAALRTALVLAGKTVLVPPYPGEKYLYLRLHRSLAPSSALARAGDKREYLQWAEPLELQQIPVVDAVVVAACVVAPNGVRLGKGKGYGEVEWGILTEIGAVEAATTPVFTICHELQVVCSTDLPPALMQDHDLPVDAFATPTRLVRCGAFGGDCGGGRLRRPTGVRWELVGPELEEDIGALRALRELGAEGAARLRAGAAAARAARARAAATHVDTQEWEAAVAGSVAHFAMEEARSAAGGNSAGKGARCVSRAGRGGGRRPRGGRPSNGAS